APSFPARLLARPSGVGAGAAEQVPALISPAAGATFGRAATVRVAGRWLQLRVRGRIARIAGVPPGSRFVLLPAWALGHRGAAPTRHRPAGPGPGHGRAGPDRPPCPAGRPDHLPVTPA